MSDSDDREPPEPYIVSFARHIKKEFSADWGTVKTVEHHDADAPEPSTSEPLEDYDYVVKLITKFESAYDRKVLTHEKIAKYQAELDNVSNEYEYDPSLDGLYSAFYELQALIHKSAHNNELALKFLTEAADVLPPNQEFVSKAAQTWQLENSNAAPVNTAQPIHFQNSAPKKKKSSRAKILFFSVVGILILLGVLANPISDYLTIAGANPTMVKLAHDASMSREGELVFLRADPQLVSSSQLSQECPAAQTNNDGFIEQGCYVPNQSDPTTGNIYLLKMPSALYNVEVTTAAYEMLHPVYFSLTQDSGAGSSLNQSIENNFNTLKDANLTAQVGNFAKTEPGARDNELFSILGTEYSDLSSDLAAYYSPYFSNIGTDVSLNNQINQLFQNDQSQLTQLQNTINTDNSDANTAYKDSVGWANEGNEYEDNYNYNIYSQDIDNANSTIDQYNQLLTQYEVLVDQFNGQPFSQDTPTQTQTQ